MSSSAKAVVSYGPYQNNGWKLQDITVTQTCISQGWSGYEVCYPRIMGHEN
jgi:hypothetical protein